MLITSTHIQPQAPTRTAVRGIIVDQENRIALVCRTKGEGDYALPGGGQEKDEGLLDTLHREIKEECGVDITNIRFVGHYIHGYQAIIKKNYQSYCYLGYVYGPKKSLQLEDYEKQYGFEIKRYTRAEAETILSSQPHNKFTFISQESLVYFQKAKKIHHQYLCTPKQ